MEVSSQNNKEKLMEIYGKYRNRMYITACRVLKDPYLAEDAVHDTVVSLSRNIEKLEAADSIRTASYVIKATRNTALNMIKKKSFEIPVIISEEEIRSDEACLDMICEKENFEYIVSAISSLDEKYRDVLSLYYLNELSVAEIAEVLSRKENTVKQQLARGRRKLTELIRKELEENEKESIA